LFGKDCKRQFGEFSSVLANAGLEVYVRHPQNT
jgi:hypothetical protein